MNTNLLDLNNDVLNIIGNYVKKDNAVIIEKLIKESFKQVDVLYGILNELHKLNDKNQL